MEEETDIKSNSTRETAPIFSSAPTQEPENRNGNAVIIEAEETTSTPEPGYERAHVLAEVLDLVTASKASAADIERVLRSREVLGATGTIPRLGEAKLRDIVNEFDSIEAEALADNEEPEPEPANLGTL